METKWVQVASYSLAKSTIDPNYELDQTKGRENFDLSRQTDGETGALRAEP